MGPEAIPVKMSNAKPLVFRGRSDTVEKAPVRNIRERSRRGSLLGTNQASGVLLVSARVVDARKRVEEGQKYYVYAIGTFGFCASCLEGMNAFSFSCSTTHTVLTHAPHTQPTRTSTNSVNWTCCLLDDLMQRPAGAMAGK